MKSKTLLFSFISVFLLSAGTSFASDSGMTKEEFTQKCLLLATGSQAEELNCVAKTQQDADLLSSVGIAQSFEIQTKKAKVGVWGDGISRFHSEVAFVIKKGLFGLNTKFLRVRCDETRKGDVVLKSKDITVDIEDHIDSMTTAKVICR